LGIEILRVIIFVSGLAFFFATATTLALDASINPKATHFVSGSVLPLTYLDSKGLNSNYEEF
jgi:hypothetical protein